MFGLLVIFCVDTNHVHPKRRPVDDFKATAININYRTRAFPTFPGPEGEPRRFHWGAISKKTHRMFQPFPKVPQKTFCYQHSVDLFSSNNNSNNNNNSLNSFEVAPEWNLLGWLGVDQGTTFATDQPLGETSEEQAVVELSAS